MRKNTGLHDVSHVPFVSSSSDKQDMQKGAPPHESTRSLCIFHSMLLQIYQTQMTLPLLQDFEFAVRQTASIERQVEAGTLPAPLRQTLAALCGVFYSRSQHVQAMFRKLDHTRCGWVKYI